MIDTAVNPIVNEVAQYLYGNYPQLRTLGAPKDLESFVENFKDTIIINRIADSGEITGVGVYIMIDDVALAGVQHGIYNLRNTEEFKEVMNSVGDNMHFFVLAAKNFRTIRIGLRYAKQLRKPKTISWFTPDMSRFVIFKGVK